MGNVMIVSYIFFYVSPIVNPIIFSTRSKTFHHVFWNRVLKSKSKRKESFIKRYLKQKSASSTTSNYFKPAPRISQKSRNMENMPVQSVDILKPANGQEK